ncbi:hypothetical protein GCM10011575_00930 [Microlunatus endophyticus]|uniref:Uncharacterized protein n=1 Tax=Microlunatus endophyticus TaxID=1716077 RepID=A0A917RYX6_9ACTN|nr:hypothetical protein [Microlunatus endophyticus]GGL46912.1 hypothetical protein GCM10011575_00930 [Microlunatus endophyticus]
MSVSHATPSFLHSHRHTDRRTAPKSRAAMDPQRRSKLILEGIGAFLFAVLITGFIGLALTIAPTPGPSSAYGADGASYVTPPNWAVFWLVVILMDVVALFAYGIASASRAQQ